MTGARWVSVVATVVIPVLIFLGVNAGKDDLILTSRSINRQLRKSTDPETFHFFMNKYRFPEGNPDAQSDMFSRLYGDLRRFIPESVAYGGREPMRTEDGQSRVHRQVVMTGTNESNSLPMTLRLEWIRYKANWYLQDYSRE